MGTPNLPAVPPEKPTSFNRVFSITWKVLLSLAVISLIVWFATGIVGGLSRRLSLSHEKDERQLSVEEADARRTSMPKSQWDRGVAKAVARHCIFDGMSMDEILLAFGEPTERSGYNSLPNATLVYDWNWRLPDGDCVKYDGEKCVERKKNQRIVWFTAKGNAAMNGGGCSDKDYRRVEPSSSALFAK
jgi:hypothetical protein